MSASVTHSTPADAELRAKLLTACGSDAWTSEVAAGWPYPELDDLLLASERAFDGLGSDDWLKAFAAHARIGQPKPGDAQGRAEQAGVADAATSELQQLATLNAEYEQRYGHVFLICASGLGAAQMLTELRERIVNPAATEFENAKREQRKITALRLRTAFSSWEIPSRAIPT